MAQDDSELEKINRRMQSIEARLSRLESANSIREDGGHLFSKEQGSQIGPKLDSVTVSNEEKGLE